MEIVLGIDNIVFISILVGRLPASEQARARTIGLFLAVIFRVGLLFGITWIVGLVTPLLTIKGFALSGRDLILLGGGLFLMAKSTTEIHAKLEGEAETGRKSRSAKFGAVVAQIAILDMVFSLDSVITAVGLVDHISIMIIAVLISLGFMLYFSSLISDFIHKHPTMKMLALSFLLMIGLLLFVEAFHVHVPKGYVYTAMAFSLFVEFLNTKMRGRTKPIELRENAP
jgi:predicted tellurium resistance membrane protein TerC